MQIAEIVKWLKHSAGTADVYGGKAASEYAAATLALIQEPAKVVARARATTAAFLVASNALTTLTGGDKAVHDRLLREEQTAFDEMKDAKQAVRDHIYETYGVPLGQLDRL